MNQQLNNPEQFPKAHKCVVCGLPTNQPFSSFMEHFAFYEPGQLQYWRGNITMFGFWSGLMASICISFPFINTIVHWRHRKSQLVIPVQK